MCLQREAIKDTTALGNNNVLYGMKLSADSSISFFYSKEESLMENYWGKAYGDSLVLEVRKASHPKHKTLNTVRNYKFFSYQEIFNCNWVYLKPNPIKLE